MTDRLHAEVDGTDGAPVLVLGPSLGTTCALWEPLLPMLTTRYRVVRYDHLGHGESDAPAGPYSIDRLGQAVLELLDRLGLDRIRYAGLSLGGMLGLWLAAHAPGRIEVLTAICTAARLPAEPWRDRIDAVRTGGLPMISGPVVDRWFTRSWAVGHPDVVQAFRSGLESTPRDGYLGCCEAIAAMDLRPRLARLTTPTLVIGAAGDTAIPTFYQREIAAAVPSARLQVLDDAAHLAPVQQPQAVARMLLAQLSPEHPGAGG